MVQGTFEEQKANIAGVKNEELERQARGLLRDEGQKIEFESAMQSWWLTGSVCVGRKAELRERGGRRSREAESKPAKDVGIEQREVGAEDLNNNGQLLPLGSEGTQGRVVDFGLETFGDLQAETGF